VFIFVPG